MQPADILTPLQLTFLRHFFATSTGRKFFLAGGTALAAYHLQHRYSDDLDLFTLDDEALEQIRHEIPHIARSLNCDFRSGTSTPTFQQFFLVAPGQPSLKLDLVRDVDFQFGQHLLDGDIIVDSLDNLAAGKIAAIFGRTDSKDFVDVYVLLRAGQDLETMIAQAQEKDAGLSKFWLAGMMRQVQQLSYLPRMLRPLEIDELKRFFLELADNIFASLNPEERNPFGA